MSEGVVVQDASGHIEFANDSAERILGLTVDRMLNRTSVDPRWRAVHPDGSPFPGELHPSMVTLRTGQALTAVIMGIHKPDGTLNWISVNSRPIPRDGKPEAVVATFVEITEPPAADRLLRQSEERLRSVALSAQFGTYDADLESGLVYWSPEARSILDWGGEDAPIRYFDVPGRIHTGDVARVNQLFEEALDPAGDGSFADEHRLVLRDGRIRWVQNRGQVHFAGAGGSRHAVRFTGTLFDTTERQSIEEAASRQYDADADCRPDIIWTIDPSGRFTSVSPSAEAATGYSVADLAGLHYLETISPTQRAPLRSLLERQLARASRKDFRRGTLIRFETEILCKDGTIYPVEIQATLAWSADGQLAGMTGITRDITDRKQAESVRATLWRQLAQARKMESIGRLAGGVAHDFNNLLTVINGYAALALREAGQSNPLRSRLEEIQRAGERAAGLTRQLLAFSRKQVMQPCVQDLDQAIAAMMPMLSGILGDEIRVDLVRGPEPAAVNVDPNQLRQVILNLAVNAREAMPGGGCFTIATRLVDRTGVPGEPYSGIDSGRFAVMRISDTGTGMDRATLELIFEPFFTTKDASHGAGLGLPTVHGIVTQSGGYIEVESEAGCGTAFDIYFPAVMPARAEDGEATAASGGVWGPSILVVDDQADVREYVSIALETYGYPVLKAAGGAEAISLFRRHADTVGLVLTDIVMPGMSGRELVMRLEQMRPGIRALFMSGHTDWDPGIQGGFQRDPSFLQKPFGPDLLARKVREAMSTVPARQPVELPVT